ncbi:hypothetical protein CVT26_012061, partial [Gymnopilus dilepis]
MAYPRRQSGSHLAPSRPRVNRNSSDEDFDIRPPRPFFLAENAANRSSSSSIENSSLDPPSDSDDSNNRAPPRPSAAARVPPRTHARRRSSMSNSNTVPLPAENDQPASRRDSYPQLESPTATSPLLRQQMPSSRPPPSSFSFPFQAYPGNPDPAPSLGRRRSRSSLEMDTMPQDMSYQPVSTQPPLSPTGSFSDLRKPFAPFMSENASGSRDSLPRSSSSNSLYKQSAAANMMPASAAAAASITNPQPLHSNHSVQSFRAPFLSPASRPTSTLWSPPSYAQFANAGSIPVSPSASTTALPLGASPYATVVAKSKPPPLPSTRLAAPLDKSEKPWLAHPEPRSRLAYFLTYLCIFLGAAAAAVICWQGISSVDVLDPNSLCLVMDEEFSGSDLDSSTWNKDVELGGFGNGEFEMTTDSSDNLFVQNGELFIMPTVTSAKVGNIYQGNFTLQGCTAGNSTGCTVVANQLRGTVINPVQSARINTKGKKSIKYGKVEVRAKLPTGDWLWPAIWMLPENNTYGPWPLSGEIDIIEARGNGPSYPAQGSNFVRSTLSYGPLPTLVNRVYGWFSMKRSSFSSSFHVYTFEWTENFIRVSVDSKLHAMLTSETKPGHKKNSYWAKAGFPETARNGTDGQGELVVVQDPYEVAGATRAAPFDQKFYLIVDVAAGGTSGWFPDNKGGKPWFDQ